MADIKRYTDKIRHAIYGREVRGSLADGIEAINSDVIKNKTDVDNGINEIRNFENRINQAENTRVSNENTRKAAENERISNETNRANAFNQLNANVRDLMNKMNVATNNANAAANKVNDKVNHEDTLIKVSVPSDRDCNSFKTLNAFCVFDTGGGDFKNTPYGTLAQGSSKVFVIKNIGFAPTRIQQSFTFVYNERATYIRNYDGDRNSWSDWSIVYNSANKPTAADIGAWSSADVSQAAQAYKVVQRDNAGDVNCRLIRTSYQDENYLNGAIAFRTNNTNDNYTRYCNSPAAVMQWLGAVPNTGVSQIEGRINIGLNGKYLSLGIGDTDAAIQNTKSGKWLQLKDDGRLCYSDKEIFTQDHFNNKLGLPGYQMLPSGLILQWGYISGLNSKNLYTVNLPISLQDNNYIAVVTASNGSNVDPKVKTVYLKSTNFKIQTYADGLDACWLVIGHV